MRFTTVLATWAATLVAAKDGRTFAVLRFNGDGGLVTGRMDPIVSPGETSSHVHMVQGGSNFGISATGEDMAKSKCSTAKIKGDNSAYWVPQLYFQDPKNGSFEKVPLFYMNVYYFFESTDDDIKAFPVGLKMVSGDAMASKAPATGDLQLDAGKGTIQAAQFTCPRSNYDPASYPANSDGSEAGIGDSQNKGAGAGFPFAECDGYASPLRADVHFPSCYNPNVDKEDYKNNMVFPTDSGGKQNCPKGWLHVPHLFFEVYWNTPLFIDRWTPNQGSQPFLLASGDVSGYRSHGDFLAAWDQDVLQTIIDTCDAGDAGMDKCPNLLQGLNPEDEKCKIESPIDERIDGVLDKLPGNNPLVGWKYGFGGGSGTEPRTTGKAQPSATSTAAGEGATSTNTQEQEQPEPTTAKEATPTSSVEAAATSSQGAGHSQAPAYSQAAVVDVPNRAVGEQAKSSGSAAMDAPAPTGQPEPQQGSERTTTVVDYVTEYTTVTVAAGKAQPTKGSGRRHRHLHNRLLHYHSNPKRAALADQA